MNYTIMIDDAQRLALLKMIQTQGKTEELEYWEEMLAELPEIEAADPKCIHGFCL